MTEISKLKKIFKKGHRRYTKRQLRLFAIAVALVLVFIIGTGFVIGNDGSKTFKYWPEKEFASVPVFEGSECYTELTKGRATITVSNATPELLKTYKTTLISAGATLITESDYYSAFVFEDMDIQIIYDDLTPQIILLNEPTLKKLPENLKDFTCFDAGRAVHCTEDSESSTTALSFRGVLPSDIIAYMDTLTRSGWVIGKDATGISADGEHGFFYHTYRKGSSAITVDYYANVMECLITYRSNIDVYDENFN